MGVQILDSHEILCLSANIYLLFFFDLSPELEDLLSFLFGVSPDDVDLSKLRLSY